jgi:hypothetical protein
VWTRAGGIESSFNEQHQPAVANVFLFFSRQIDFADSNGILRRLLDRMELVHGAGQPARHGCRAGSDERAFGLTGKNFRLLPSILICG